MDRNGFCHKFDCDAMKLDGFIGEGMPWRGDRSDPEFDEAEVATWLLVNGKAAIDASKVARTATDAAQRLGISRQTLHAWAKINDFPGRPGLFPIEEIREWDASRSKRVNQYASQEDIEKKPSSNGELSIKERRDLLKLQQEQGLLVEVIEVKRIMQLSTSYAIAELNLIAGKFESKLPAGTDEELVAIMRETIKQTVREACTILMEMDFRDDDDAKLMDDAEQSSALVHSGNQELQSNDRRRMGSICSRW